MGNPNGLTKAEATLNKAWATPGKPNGLTRRPLVTMLWTFYIVFPKTSGGTGGKRMFFWLFGDFTGRASIAKAQCVCVL